MVSLDTIKIPLFEDISDEHLSMLAELATLERYDDGAVIFRRGENASVFYILKKGEAILEQELGSDVTATIGVLKPGSCMGLAALTPDGGYKATAVAKGQCEVLFLGREEIIGLMDEHPALGYGLLKPLYAQLVDGMELRTAQFLQVLTQHPELKSVL